MSIQLTEEQIWEEVETWVNSLVEEGYDLSDYTWEDMYEAYLTELKGVPVSFFGRAGHHIWQGAKPVAKKVLSQLGKFGVAGAVGLTADELLTRGAGRELVGKALQQTRKLGPALRGEPTDSVGTAKPKPSGETGQIISAAGGKGGKVTVGKEYAATLGGKKGTVKYDPSGKKSFTAQLNASYEYDAFDLILEYLTSQGHVETLDEALYVMMEMDEKVIQDIVSEAFNNIIVSHLLDEGYAESLEAAEVMLFNMSEEWRESICEDLGLISGLAGLALGAKGALHAAKKTKRLREYPKNFVKGIVDPRTYVPKRKK
jgi:hypothetical protein